MSTAFRKHPGDYWIDFAIRQRLLFYQNVELENFRCPILFLDGLVI